MYQHGHFICSHTHTYTVNAISLQSLVFYVFFWYLETNQQHGTLWEKRIFVVEGGLAVVDCYRVRDLKLLVLGEYFWHGTRAASRSDFVSSSALSWLMDCLALGMGIDARINNETNQLTKIKIQMITQGWPTNYTNSKFKCCAWQQASAVSNKRGHAFLAGWLGFQGPQRCFQTFPNALSFGQVRNQWRICCIVT